MKAAVVPGVNAPWGISEVPTPSPGPGEVLIRVRACGVCANDVWLTRGVFDFPSATPSITGHEPVGEVVALGAGVDSRSIGDRVGTTWVQGTCERCDYCLRRLPVGGQAAMNCAAPVLTGITVPGGHAEYMTVPAEATVRIPDGVPYELAAPMMCAGYTAWSALRVGAPTPSDRVAVLGIGGLGHLAVQFSDACGFETIAVTGSPDKHDLARQLGASMVVGNGEELRAAGGADVILATGKSHRAAADAMRGLRVNGRMVLAGLDPSEAFTIPPDVPFFAQGQRVLGATHEGLDHLVEALDFVESGKVTPVVEVFAMDQVADAVERVAKGEVRFRAVVTY
ncbi:alcohol dehydrogenase catalytic domain-containing protein [Nocardiopsis ansamitocini]|uniref:alcohol dehydrogenase n=1 Tax=Nocardiopsis ansamitocini TaxID=1670832 RepID=A0A9W6P804_9ACTN|nr:alcohol dehydrogenase catalytic domain-containing protein [Nocardiopsis ansamitocini]GLU48697.1 alcohol dehydrogenase [Nocardiopsis ansamitocini]